MPATRRMTLDVTEDQVRVIVRDLDTTFRLKSFERLHGGSQEVYRIDLAGAEPPLVLKLYADRPSWRPAKEALVSGWIDRDLGAAIPRWLRVDESRERLPLRYALMSWLPGRTVRDLMHEPGVESVYRQMGAVLRRLHTIPMEAYGYILDKGIDRPRASNAEFVTAWFEGAFRRFRDSGGDAGLSRRIESAARAGYDILDHSAGPVLCHDDFQPCNVLAAPDTAGGARLTGLIDFGNALAGDAVFDLAKSLFCSTHEDPKSERPLLEGYGPIDHPDPVRALWLYTLLHRLLMWNWLAGLGDPATAEGPAGLLRDLAATLDGA